MNALRTLLDVCERMDLEHQAGRPTEEEYQAALAGARAALADFEPFDADDPRFRAAFEESARANAYEVKRHGERYRSSYTDAAFKLAFGTVNRLRLYAAPPDSAPALAELLAAMTEVLRISDRKHEAWDRAKAAIAALENAAPSRPSAITLQLTPEQHDALMEGNEIGGRLATAASEPPDIPCASMDPCAWTCDACRATALQAEIDRLNTIVNSPHADDFIQAVSVEAEHQRQRWPSEHDAGKTPADWFWLIGYLAGKALHAHTAGNTEKAEHHVITTAAACLNWHRAIFGRTNMRPGHEDGIGAEASQA